MISSFSLGKNLDNLQVHHNANGMFAATDHLCIKGFLPTERMNGQEMPRRTAGHFRSVVHAFRRQPAPPSRR